MKVLVTRPLPDAETLAMVLTARGIEVVLEPLLTIRPKPGTAALLEKELGGVQALLFTSANGVRVFAGASPRRELPVFAVGDATAIAAKAAGFARVESAQGNVAALAKLAAARLKPGNGALLHPASSETAGDLAGDLAKAGFNLRRAAIYDSLPAESLSVETQALIRRGALDAVLFFSPRTARCFVRLAAKAKLNDGLAKTLAFALSAEVAGALREMEWQRIAVAEAPTEDSLLASLDRAMPGGNKERKAFS
jgi:uroporphyrinogen-III synthase